ncbi:beta-3 adrenergic receptor-like [Acanthaster planci]|uniref:Beta-3 adrenergic receptor-like n=1 Tax=Acanthaster planci TaxID=133434 RepID=A0A8B8A7P9_ACAPL|nr:beta-3 adrenergic receptor-like [Acanthaster planci]
MDSTTDTQTSSTAAVVVLRTFFIAMNALAIVLVNILNILILIRASIGSEPARIYISSLALADILVGLLAFCSTLPSGHDGFPFGVELCQVAGSLFAIGVMLSVTFLAFISVDRLVAVTMALRYEHLVTRKRAAVTAILAWTVISGLMLIAILLWPDIMDYNEATFFCEPRFEDANFPPVMFIGIMTWILGCDLTMTVTYGHLFRVAHRHSRRIAAQELAVTAAAVHGGGPPRRSRVIPWKDMKAVRMSLAVTLAFNVAWVPTICLDFYKFTRKTNASPGTEFAITWLSVSNSWWNFLIYSGMNKQFRDAVKHLAKQTWAKCKRGTPERQPQDRNSPVQEIQHIRETRHRVVWEGGERHVVGETSC